MMENLLFTGDRARLKDSAVPSIFSFRTSPQVSTSRSERVRRRSQKEAACPLDNVQFENEVSSDEVVENIEIDHVVNCFVDSKEIQCTLLCSKQCSIENYQNNAEAVQYYTGFDTYEHFVMFFHCVGPAAFEMDYHGASLHPKDELFLTMMKLRQFKQNLELSLFFKYLNKHCQE